MKKRLLNRRRFLRSSAAALAFPVLIPSSVLGRNGQVPPSQRITLAAIGVGNRCKHVLEHFMYFNDVQCLAVCDVRKERLEAGKVQVDSHYGNSDCRMIHDFRDALALPDLDTVLIATGDRWHALASIMAAKAGKDIYSEKPMSLTIEEGQVLVETMNRMGTVYQCGHQRRSVDSYRFQTEVAQNGMIGKVHTVIAQMWENAIIPPRANEPLPAGLDYDTWLGPTPWHPFNPARFYNWNNFYDTGGGTLVNMGCHYTDIAQWGLGTDHTTPIHYEGTAEFPPDNFADVPTSASIICRYADGRKLELHSRGAFAERYIRFVGDEGWIQVDDETNVMTAHPASVLKTRAISARSWAHPGGHIRNFLDCVKSRQETICSPGKSHRATVISHAANLCARLGRPLGWDPQQERFLNDAGANQMVSRAMRAPWHL